MTASPRISDSSESLPDPIVFVVDDDHSVRQAVSRLLTSAGYRCEAFPSAAGFLARPPADAPSCLLLDLRMPGMGGLELQKQLVEAGHRLPIVFVTGHGDVPSSVQAMRRGAVDFLLKPFTDTALLAAVETALERDRTALAERIELRRIHERLETLTPRERQVFELVVQGLLNKQVAGRIGTSEKTVKAHRANVMRKMAVDSLAALVHLAERLAAGARTSH
jgi:RNA polymerase sigma factor (sigma-70 family)